MKVSYIVGIVLPAHVVGLWILLFQPGCQTNQATAPDPALTRVEIPDPKPEPKAPVVFNESMVDDSSSGEVDTAFNAGIDTFEPVQQNVRAEPMRPVSSGYTDDYTSTDFDPSSVNVPDLDTPKGPDQFYKVKKGDTLSKIARLNNMPLASLLEANNLQRSSKIFIGQELLIPASSPIEMDLSNVEHSKIKVRKGDTLSVIAKKNGVSLSALKAANGLRTDIIYVGQELIIPGSSQPKRLESKKTPAKSGERYTVRSGDSLGKIAHHYKIKISELKAVNGLSRDTIYVGQKLYLPAGAKKSTIKRSKPKVQPKPKPVYKPQPVYQPKPVVAPAPVVPAPAPVIPAPAVMTIEDSNPQPASDDTDAMLRKLRATEEFQEPVLPVEQAVPAQ